MPGYDLTDLIRSLEGSPTGECCRCGVFKSLAGSADRIDGVFKSLVPGPVQRVGVFKSFSRRAPFSGLELIPPSPDGGDGAFSGASFPNKLRRSRVRLAAPRPVNLLPKVRNPDLNDCTKEVNDPGSGSALRFLVNKRQQFPVG